MSALRSRLALLLLLCFTRVLLPDTWVLALHAHGHTAEVSPTSGQPRAKALLTARHQHCQTDHFCALPYQVATPWVPVLRLRYRVCRATPRVSVWTMVARGTWQLRGPPARA